MTAPTINGAKDIVLVEGDKYEPLKGVTATDSAGKSVEVAVTGDKVDPNKVGEYTITYVATDSNKLTSRKTVTVTVNPRQLDLNAAPTFEGLSDKTIMLGDEFDPKAGVTAKDAEDGTIEFAVKGKVDSTKVGTYELTYTAKDSKGAAVTKVITVMVKQPVVGLNQAPTINAADVTIVQGETFDPMSGVTAPTPRTASSSSPLPVRSIPRSTVSTSWCTRPSTRTAPRPPRPSRSSCCPGSCRSTRFRPSMPIA